MPQNVFVTGASGFLAKHVLLALLRRGWRVTASVRNPGREPALRAALAPHLPDGALDRLNVVTLDLTADDGWADVMAGCDALVHTASPFPLSSPKDENDLIRPAVDGTLRALGAAQAAGITRVVLTSSTVAILGAGTREHTEDDWADAASPHTGAYARSKILAERAAWDFAASNNLSLTTINPGFILGPPLDGEYGASVGLIERMLKGRDPMVPRYGFPVVDVRDVAEMHARALERADTAGKRYAAVAGSLWMSQITAALKAAYPARRIPTRTAPDLLMRFMGMFDGSIRGIVPHLGRLEQVSNLRARTELAMSFTPPEQAVLATAAEVIRTRNL
ncbi:MAG: SDR family oxidoreductase [Paracoccaceae bacterium]